ncbi:MAG: DUF4443 domain-containing protein [Promethearchaeota archaeon]
MIIEELKEIFKSETIKPTFDFVHIILALFIFEKHSEGIGRYRLKEELLIGSGTSRSLVTKLKEKIHFLTLVGDKNKKRGHILTKNGLNYLNRIKEIIPVLEKGDLAVLKDAIVEPENARIYFCQIKNKGERLTNGIEQRDAAIKIGGMGATCLVFDGLNLNYALNIASEKDKLKMKISKKMQAYFIEELNNFNSKLEKNDVIIIGLGNSQIEFDNLTKKDRENKKSSDLASLNAARRARLSALNAALTLL